VLPAQQKPPEEQPGPVFRAQDIQLLEDSVPQKVALFEGPHSGPAGRRTIPVEVILLFDVSLRRCEKMPGQVGDLPHDTGKLLMWPRPPACVADRPNESGIFSYLLSVMNASVLGIPLYPVVLGHERVMKQAMSGGGQDPWAAGRRGAAGQARQAQREARARDKAPSAGETRWPHQVQVKLREPGSGKIYGGVRTVVH